MEAKKQTNLEHYRRRSLGQALDKYDADYAYMSGRFGARHASIGTFHDWLEFEWRDPRTKYTDRYASEHFGGVIGLHMLEFGEDGNVVSVP